MRLTAPFHEGAIMKFLEINERFAKNSLLAKKRLKYLEFQLALFIGKGCIIRRMAWPGLLIKGFAKPQANVFRQIKLLKLLTFLKRKIMISLSNLSMKNLPNVAVHTVMLGSKTLSRRPVLSKKQTNAANIGVKGQDVHEPRMVNNDNTVRYKNRILQLEPDKMRINYAKFRVQIHEYPNGGLSVFSGPRKLKIIDITKKQTEEEDLSDGLIAFWPSSEELEKGEAGASPLSDLGTHPALGSLPGVALSSEWQNQYR